MPLAPGEQLGNYKIVEIIGAGGMGEVYRATDSQLKRDVALKVLPALFSSDPERMARFQREAEVLASLDHPNVAPIFGMVDADGVRALALSLVEGPTLEDRIANGPVPLEEAVAIAVQIVAALEYAHERGIIHRDLKPANIKITPDGVVKVLDFGLAKVLEDDQTQPSGANSPTLTLGHTRVGVLLGTAAYMSPEQAVGKPADRRSDIFSFGSVLFEMLTGKRPFAGDTVGETLVSVAKDELDWSALPGSTPRSVENLLRRCLTKDRKRRLQAIGEARIVLETPILDEPKNEAPVIVRASRLPWLVGAAAFAAALVLAFLYFRRPAEDAPIIRLSIPLPEKAVLTGQTLPAVSPDGRRIAFTAISEGKTALWVRDLDSLGARALPYTEGALFPFWSPDGHMIGFFADGKLKKIDIAGGPALTLCEITGDPRGGTWNREGDILFVPDRVNDEGIFRVSASGGVPSVLLATDRSKGDGFRFPWFLPDGRHFLYLHRVSDVAASRIDVGDLESKTARPLLPATSNAIYAAGHLLFARERTLMAQPFDTGKLQTTGEPVPIAEQVDYVTVDQRAHFSSSQNGVLAYVSGGVVGGNLQLTWFDRSGRVVGTLGGPGLSRWPAISPDEKTIAFYRVELQSGINDIWLHDVARGSDSRFTFGRANSDFPVWSPDGSELAFRSGSDYRIYRKGIGVTEQTALDDTPPNKRADDWSRNGRFLIEERAPLGKSGSDIWVLPLFGDRKPFPYLQSEFNERWAKLSPGGQWLAYSSDETKRNEVYVQTFPNPGGKWQVSANGGDRPVWSRDGKELFFISADGKMMAVGVRSGKDQTDFNAGAIKPLFDVHMAIQDCFDVSKDGRFLIPITVASGASNVPMTAVVNWPSGIKK